MMTRLNRRLSTVILDSMTEFLMMTREVGKRSIFFNITFEVAVLPM
jgi:hypothetical protein